MLNLIILSQLTTSDRKLYASSPNQIIIQNQHFVIISIESKILEYFANQAVKE